MKSFIPRHINEVESDRRGVKDGWYATSTTGKLGNGPFSNREDCLADINRLQATIDAYHHWAVTRTSRRPTSKLDA
jgi:hypothetical protein